MPRYLSEGLAKQLVMAGCCTKMERVAAALMRPFRLSNLKGVAATIFAIFGSKQLQRITRELADDARLVFFDDRTFLSLLPRRSLTTVA